MSEVVHTCKSLNVNDQRVQDNVFSKMSKGSVSLFVMSEQV